MPSSPVGKDGKYYDVQVKCTSSKTSGLWDYNAWRLNLDYIESNSKCNLTFTSSMTKAQYDEYIKSGVALRRNTYRGKDITKYYTGDEKVNNRDLFEQISNCTFDDIYVGDYIKTNKDGHEITWLIADLNNYLGTGRYSPVDLKIYKCHATIVTDGSLEYGAPMNDSDTTGIVYPSLSITNLENKVVTNIGGYMGSKMKQETLPHILQTYVEPVFGKHIIEYSTELSDAMDETKTSSNGTLNGGAASRANWYSSKIDLMSEVEVLGTSIVANEYDIGVENRQYALFQLRPELITNTTLNVGFTYWLRTVVDSKNFFGFGNIGNANKALASVKWAGVRPRFLID